MGTSTLWWIPLIESYIWLKDTCIGWVFTRGSVMATIVLTWLNWKLLLQNLFLVRSLLGILESWKVGGKSHPSLPEGQIMPSASGVQPSSLWNPLAVHSSCILAYLVNGCSRLLPMADPELTHSAAQMQCCLRGFSSQSYTGGKMYLSSQKIHFKVFLTYVAGQDLR